MKNQCLYIFCIYLSAINVIAQTWLPRANVGGPGREYAVTFSIDNKGYIATGWDLSNVRNDLWEYDPLNNTWTQKANLTGPARGYAVGFSIGKKGYIGTGGYADFWEWDQTNDTWTKKADFPGGIRTEAVGFSIGNKGYIGMGNCSCNDFWEWDGDSASATYNTWIQRSNFIGGSGTRAAAVAFSIGKKGYVATGYKPLLGYRELWEWDGDTTSPAFNTWTQKANYGGTGRNSAAGFAIGTKAYVGTGDDGDSLRSDFWEWDQQTDMWTQKPRFAGTARFNGVGFYIGNIGYLGTGNDYSGNYRNDFWMYCDTCPLIGVESFDKAALFLYPNPATTKLFMEQSNANNVSEVKLLDLLGKERITTELRGERISIDLSDLQNGVYFVSVKTGHGVIIKKIIVQR